MGNVRIKKTHRTVPVSTNIVRLKPLKPLHLSKPRFFRNIFHHLGKWLLEW